VSWLLQQPPQTHVCLFHQSCHDVLADQSFEYAGNRSFLDSTLDITTRRGVRLAKMPSSAPCLQCVQYRHVADCGARLASGYRLSVLNSVSKVPHGCQTKSTEQELGCVADRLLMSDWLIRLSCLTFLVSDWLFSLLSDKASGEKIDGYRARIIL